MDFITYFNQLGLFSESIARAIHHVARFIKIKTTTC